MYRQLAPKSCMVLAEGRQSPYAVMMGEGRSAKYIGLKVSVRRAPKGAWTPPETATMASSASERGFDRTLAHWGALAAHWVVETSAVGTPETSAVSWTCSNLPLLALKTPREGILQVSMSLRTFLSFRRPENRSLQHPNGAATKRVTNA